MKKETYSNCGISVSKALIKAGDEIELKYSGLLKQAGAGELMIHLGYNDNWEEAETLPMTAINDAFAVRILVKKARTLNCAFVDPLGNWDNYSGANYSFKITASKNPEGKKSPSKDKKASKDEKPSKVKKETKAEKDTVKAKKSPKKAESEAGKAKKEAAAFTEAAEKVAKPGKTRKATKA